ncbi:MAG: prepilin-type N-terminal cleavage/methylation domain-containing protein [Gammaproteobacteria bacterium]|nr:prepilin-type N-terminal cleavage/methylation domain-containing protein [Gammaproteobacteria bacterium]
MNNWQNYKGFSFFELMIAVAVIGILSAVAIPAYRGYIDTANMTKVTAGFEESVRFVVASFARRKTRLALGIVEKIPDTTNEWIVVLNPSGYEAPGGGPAFIPSKNKKGQKGDPLTGAIGVRWKKAKPAKVNKKGRIKPGKPARLELWRPLYSDLVGQHVTITEGNLDISKFEE